MKSVTFYFVGICLIFILLISGLEVSAQNQTFQIFHSSLHSYNLLSYPNTFNPSTVISWQSAVGSKATLNVFDVLGNEIATLVNEEKPAGSYEVEFNPVSGIKYLPAGRQGPASGIYFYQLKAGEFVQTKKMILLR